MKQYTLILLFFLSYVSFLVSHQQDPAEENRKAILASIPPKAFRQLLLYAALYPDTKEGKSALLEALQTFPSTSHENLAFSTLFESNVTHLSSLSEPSLFAGKEVQEIPAEALHCIDELGSNLPHKKLKGHSALSLKEIEHLESDEIDLARALLLLEEELSPQKKIPKASVEASLDLLALSIIARIGPDADPFLKIKELNHLLFDELGVKFPPQSEANEKVHQFSELSNVLFSQRGVCLGASTLYLSLAQRIGLPLIIYTPPGHIFVGYKQKETIRVIETTARGIDLPQEEYLGISLRSLPERSLKETIGMVAYNRASTALKDKNWDEAERFYTLAARFETDEELAQACSMIELLKGKKGSSIKRAEQAIRKPSPHKIEHDLLLLDLSKGSLSPESLEAILETADDEPETLPEEIQKLEACFANDSTSLALPLHIAQCWYSYGKPKEALPLLEKIAASHDAPPSIHFFLSTLYEDRMDFPSAWKEAKIALALAKEQGFYPQPFRKYILSLQKVSPHCEDLPDLLP